MKGTRQKEHFKRVYGGGGGGRGRDEELYKSRNEECGNKSNVEKKP